VLDAVVILLSSKCRLDAIRNRMLADDVTDEVLEQ
jgi:hypothetical protein